MPSRKEVLTGLMYYQKQMSLGDWLEKYKINHSRIADEIGIGRRTLDKIKQGKEAATLETALKIHILSGYQVDMFSMVLDGDNLHSYLEEFLGDIFNYNGFSNANKLRLNIETRVNKFFSGST